jgi:hypothetical protein
VSTCLVVHAGVVVVGFCHSRTLPALSEAAHSTVPHEIPVIVFVPSIEAGALHEV